MGGRHACQQLGVSGENRRVIGQLGSYERCPSAPDAHTPANPQAPARPSALQGGRQPGSRCEGGGVRFSPVQQVGSWAWPLVPQPPDHAAPWARPHPTPQPPSGQVAQEGPAWALNGPGPSGCPRPRRSPWRSVGRSGPLSGGDEPFPLPAPGTAGGAPPLSCPAPQAFPPEPEPEPEPAPAPAAGPRAEQTEPGLPSCPLPGGGCSSGFPQKLAPQWDVAATDCWEPPPQGQQCPSMGTGLAWGTDNYTPSAPRKTIHHSQQDPPPQPRGLPASPICTAPILGEQRLWGRGAPQTGPHRLCCVLQPPHPLVLPRTLQGARQTTAEDEPRVTVMGASHSPGRFANLLGTRVAFAWARSRCGDAGVLETL